MPHMFWVTWKWWESFDIALLVPRLSPVYAWKMHQGMDQPSNKKLFPVGILVDSQKKCDWLWNLPPTRGIFIFKEVWMQKLQTDRETFLRIAGEKNHIFGRYAVNICLISLCHRWNCGNDNQKQRKWGKFVVYHLWCSPFLIPCLLHLTHQSNTAEYHHF